MRLLVAALLVLSLAPFASAQAPAEPTHLTVVVSIKDPGHALSPGTNESIEIEGTITAGAAAAPDINPDMNDPTNSQQKPREVTFQPTKIPSWVANVSFDPPVVYVNVTPGTQARFKGTMVLLIRPDAPADERQNFTITAHVAPTTGTPEASAVSPELMLHPGLTPQLKVTLKDTGLAIIKGGRWQPIDFLVTNLGNGMIAARLNVTAAPQDSIVDAPSVVDLKAGETKTVSVMLKLPWTYGESGALTLEATPLAGDEEGKPSHADAEIAGQSAVPDLAPLLVFGIIGALALARRR